MTLLNINTSQQENRSKPVALSNVPELGRGGWEAAVVSSGFRFTVVSWEDDSQTRGHASGLKISPQYFLQLATGKQLKQIKNVPCRLSTSSLWRAPWLTYEVAQGSPQLLLYKMWVVTLQISQNICDNAEHPGKPQTGWGKEKRHSIKSGSNFI